MTQTMCAQPATRCQSRLATPYADMLKRTLQRVLCLPMLRDSVFRWIVAGCAISVISAGALLIQHVAVRRIRYTDSRSGLVIAQHHSTHEAIQIEDIRTSSRAAASLNLPLRVDVSAIPSTSLAGGNGHTTQLSDVFITVRTSGNAHKSRLQLLFDTWIPLAKNSTYIFTDIDDPALNTSTHGVDIINTHCPPTYSARALSCKVSVEFDFYMLSDKRWYCHMDDDMYLNVENLLRLLKNFSHELDWYLGKTSRPRPSNSPGTKGFIYFAHGGAGFCISRALANKIESYVGKKALQHWSEVIGLNDDCVLGYIICTLMHVNLTEVQTFHSHYEWLPELNANTLDQQVTFSYQLGVETSKSNVIPCKGTPAFNITHDLSRFLTLHCELYPLSMQCNAYRVHPVEKK